MARRTPIQLALLVMGLIVWGYGQRVDDEWLRWMGIGFFAGAFLLRFWKERPTAEADSASETDAGEE